MSAEPRYFIRPGEPYRGMWRLKEGVAYHRDTPEQPWRLCIVLNTAQLTEPDPAGVVIETDEFGQPLPESSAEEKTGQSAEMAMMAGLKDAFALACNGPDTCPACHGVTGIWRSDMKQHRCRCSAEPAPVRGAYRRVVWMCKDTGATGHGDAIPADQADAAAKLGNESEPSLMHWTEAAAAPGAGSQDLLMREALRATEELSKPGAMVDTEIRLPALPVPAVIGEFDKIRNTPEFQAAFKGLRTTPPASGHETDFVTKPTPPAEGETPEKCKTCGGEGIVPAMVDTATGPAACPYLGEPCPDCGHEDGETPLTSKAITRIFGRTGSFTSEAFELAQFCQTLERASQDRERRIAELENDLAFVRSQFDEEVAIVNRIWAMFGTPSYEELKGRSIYDLIQADRDELAALKQAGDEVTRRLQDALGILDDAPVAPKSHWAEVYREDVRPRIERAIDGYQIANGDKTAAAGGEEVGG